MDLISVDRVPEAPIKLPVKVSEQETQLSDDDDNEVACLTRSHSSRTSTTALPTPHSRSKQQLALELEKPAVSLCFTSWMRNQQLMSVNRPHCLGQADN